MLHCTCMKVLTVVYIVSMSFLYVFIDFAPFCSTGRRLAVLNHIFSLCFRYIFSKTPKQVELFRVWLEPRAEPLNPWS